MRLLRIRSRFPARRAPGVSPVPPPGRVAAAFIRRLARAAFPIARPREQAAVRHALLRLARKAPVLLLPAAALLLPAAARAAFDLRAQPPAARSCSTPDALGLAEGSVSVSYHSRHGGAPGFTGGVYAFRPFGLANLEVSALCARACPPGGSTGVGIRYTRLSAPLYTEQELALSLGLARGHLWMEPGVRFARAEAPGLAGGTCLMLDLAVYDYITERLRISFSVDNAMASGLDLPGGAAPTVVGAGIGYAISRSTACGLRLDKQNGLRTSLSTGLEWRAGPGLFLRLGSCTFPREVSMGVGLEVRGVCMDIASTLNLDLGMTHEAGIAFARR